MEENVALDSSKQKKFVKSLKGIKKLIKKTDETPQHTPPDLAPKKSEKIKKRQFKRKPKGLVYLSHIPHGFFEHQMSEYFKQFGGVTNVRVIRSKRTGNSRGCAFVEFKEPAVAEIVAETMNNYLMGKRLIKAEVIPHKKQRRATRMQWSPTNNPGFELKKKIKKNFNTNRDDAGDLKRARKIVANLMKTKAKLNAMGIQFDFAPVDVPNELQDNVKQLQSQTDIVKDEKEEIEKKPTTKKQKAKVEEKKETSTSVVQKGKKLENSKNAKVDNKTKTQVSKETKKGINLKNGKAVENNTVANKKLKERGVIPLDNFIKIQSDEDVSDDDSRNEEISDEEGSGEDISAEEDEEGSGEDSDDSAVEFDEEAYDKMVDSSESLLSNEDADSEVEDESESDEKTQILINTRSKNKAQLKQVPNMKKKPGNKKVQQAKRKAEPKVQVSPKKSKFAKKKRVL